MGIVIIASAVTGLHNNKSAQQYKRCNFSRVTCLRVCVSVCLSVCHRVIVSVYFSSPVSIILFEFAFFPIAHRLYILTLFHIYAQSEQILYVPRQNTDTSA